MRGCWSFLLAIVIALGTVTSWAIDSLGRESHAATEISKLVEEIKAEPSADLRIDLMERLGNRLQQIGPDKLHKSAIDGIISLLEDNSSTIRLRAASQLGFIGKRAERAIPALEKLFRAEECAMKMGGPGAAEASYAALRKMGVNPAITRRCSRFWVPPPECVLSFNMDWSEVETDPASAQNALKLPRGRPWLKSLDKVEMDGSRLHLDFKENCDQKEEVFEKLLAYWRANKIPLPKFERFEEPVPDYSPQ